LQPAVVVSFIHNRILSSLLLHSYSVFGSCINASSFLRDNYVHDPLHRSEVPHLGEEPHHGEVPHQGDV
jgi:hypothetical protein